jgi:hypothetical protein
MLAFKAGLSYSAEMIAVVTLAPGPRNDLDELPVQGAIGGEVRGDGASRHRGNALSPDSIRSGFRSSGILPIDRVRRPFLGR